MDTSTTRDISAEMAEQAQALRASQARAAAATEIALEQKARADELEERIALQEEGNPFAAVLADETEKALVAKAENRWELAARLIAQDREQTRTGFQLVTADEIYAPLEPPDYLIDAVLRRGSLLLLAAYGSSSKTWQALDVGVAVGSGTNWVGRFATKQGRFTFIDYESGKYEVRRRMQLLTRGRRLDRIEAIDFVSMPAGLYIGEAPFNEALERLAAERDVIAIDSLKAGSNADENDSRIRRGLDDIHAIGERTGCAFVVLVHAKKTSGAPSKIDDREILRGSSGIFDAADTVIASFYNEEDESFSVRQVKSRLGGMIDPFVVRLVDVDGGVRVAAEDMPAKETGEQASKLACLKAGVLKAVKDNAGQLRSANDICALVTGGNKSAKLIAIRQLEEEENRILKVAGAYRVAAQPVPVPLIKGGDRETGPGTDWDRSGTTLQ